MFRLFSLWIINKIFLLLKYKQLTKNSTEVRNYIFCVWIHDKLTTGTDKQAVSSSHGRFGSKVGQICPKRDKSEAFFRSDFSAFGAGAPNSLNSDLKKTRICPIWGQSDPIWSQTYHPCVLGTTMVVMCKGCQGWSQMLQIWEPKCTETDLKKSQICESKCTETDLKKLQIWHIWYQFNPILVKPGIPCRVVPYFLVPIQVGRVQM